MGGRDVGKQPYVGAREEVLAHAVAARDAVEHDLLLLDELDDGRITSSSGVPSSNLKTRWETPPCSVTAYFCAHSYTPWPYVDKTSFLASAAKIGSESVTR